MNHSRAKIMVMTDWFEPGFKAGGPIRSTANLVQALKEEFDIYVLTTDRDFGDERPYPGIRTDSWLEKEGYNIFYASPQHLGWQKLFAKVKEVEPRVLYLNSMFSRHFTLYPLAWKKMGKLNSSIILAPRGMLKASALDHKPVKKKIFLAAFKFTGLKQGLIFHATDELEEKNIREIFGEGTAIFQLPNLPGVQYPFSATPEKQPGELKIIFIGRIHPIKNLDFLLRALSSVPADIQITIIAPLEDEHYWNICRNIMATLPKRIKVNVLQEVQHKELDSLIRQHHIFALPTKGENFGHSVFEAMAAGRPVLISDQTPWKNLESRRAGIDLPLNQAAFSEAIEKFAAMNNEEMQAWCRGAWEYCKEYISKSNTRDKYVKLFSLSTNLE